MILVQGLKAFLAAELPQRTQEVIEERRRKLRARRFSSQNEGDAYRCIFCDHSYARFMKAGLDYPVIKEKKIVAGGLRDNVVCPACGSMDRERLARLVLTEQMGLRPHHDTLHVAPEPMLYEYLSKTVTGRLVACDLFPDDRPGVPNIIKQDLTKLEFDDGSFDIVICNHVMEHIPADVVAMTEIKRVLRPGGKALLQVPYSEVIETTEEDLSVITNAERIARYGQSDHVRLYEKQDYVRRLKEAGFDVQMLELDALKTYRRYAVNPEECAFVARKPE
ncbi:class I SAM-dependent methyltransferase [Denitrobaculum tricleocarpae]|uniref:Methyltransferase domain-containing protein n=1 Tax=Denitrobaculum tricleocarpae TaxID=2591009 RepID=A0A545T5I6_9PROT|nr:class I SAM-dependent methyltransferase [Denitrobaculum tricleocarpae]TQV72501.1 methyltransferase domain-containing protein [Denitrobaculum tricleocarpae]